MCRGRLCWRTNSRSMKEKPEAPQSTSVMGLHGRGGVSGLRDLRALGALGRAGKPGQRPGKDKAGLLAECLEGKRGRAGLLERSGWS